MPETVNYMERSRLYYEAQGFTRAYRWAEHAEIPWQASTKRLSDSKVTFITTAVPDGSIPKLSRSASSHLMVDMPARFRTDELSWDKEATHTDDLGSYIPLEPLKQLLEMGIIGELSDRYHFIPTEYSQKNTVETDAPLVTKACVDDEIDIAILIPL